MGKRRTPPPEPTPHPQDNVRQRVWNNAWGMGMGLLTLAPIGDDGCEPVATGIRIWFEPPRHGWLFPHVVLVNCGEFICRASDVENDFLSDLTNAILGILRTGEPTEANAFAEPQSFSFRFTRSADSIVCTVVTFNRFTEPVAEETILTLATVGDGVCRAFCFGIRELQRAVPAEEYARSYTHPFPTAALAELCAALGGEFVTENI